jgi:hypothetical protein
LQIIRHQFFFFDEAQNYRIWSSEYPHAFVQTRLYPIKVGVWIVASRRRLIAFIVKIEEPVINEPLFFYLVYHNMLQSGKNQIYSSSTGLLIYVCSFIDTLYNL